MGVDCTHTGSIPSKTTIYTANRYHPNHAGALGLHALNPAHSLEFDVVMEHVEDIAGKVRQCGFDIAENQADGFLIFPPAASASEGDCQQEPENQYNQDACLLLRQGFSIYA